MKAFKQCYDNFKKDLIFNLAFTKKALHIAMRAVFLMQDL